MIDLSKPARMKGENVKKFFMVLLFLVGIGAVAYFLWQRQAEGELRGTAPRFKGVKPQPRASAVGQ